ncbi:MAG: hypothetical protein R3Y63_15290 [Eubacteriales bacterium]
MVEENFLVIALVHLVFFVEEVSKQFLAHIVKVALQQCLGLHHKGTSAGRWLVCYALGEVLSWGKGHSTGGNPSVVQRFQKGFAWWFVQIYHILSLL